MLIQILYNMVAYFMIKKIRLLLEYGTYPIWLYNENDEIIDNVPPPEWENDKELDELTTNLIDNYEKGFINTPKIFEYIGFKSEKEKSTIRALADKIAKLVEQKNNGKYIIVNDFQQDLDCL